MSSKKSLLLSVVMAGLLTVTLMSGAVVADRGDRYLDDSEDDSDDDNILSSREQRAVDKGWTDEESMKDAKETALNLEHKGNPAKDIAKSCTIAGVAGASFGGPAGATMACGLSTAETIGNPRNYETGSS